MSFRDRRAAVRELKTADKALAALVDETDQTDRWRAANLRVAAAEMDPNLTNRDRRRYLDPRDQ